MKVHTKYARLVLYGHIMPDMYAFIKPNPDAQIKLIV